MANNLLGTLPAAWAAFSADSARMINGTLLIPRAVGAKEVGVDDMEVVTDGTTEGDVKVIMMGNSELMK